MAGRVPPAGPKSVRRGEGPAIHVFRAARKIRRGCPRPVLVAPGTSISDSNVKQPIHIVIARSESDEATQSLTRGIGLLRFARNDADRVTRPPSRGTLCARAMRKRCPSKAGGRREDRVLATPAASRATKSTRVSDHRFGRQSGLPCAMVYDLFRALPGEPDFVVTVIDAMRKHRRQLGTSLGVPEPHDFAVRVGASRQQRRRVHRIPSRVS